MRYLVLLLALAGCASIPTEPAPTSGLGYETWTVEFTSEVAKALLPRPAKVVTGFGPDLFPISIMIPAVPQLDAAIIRTTALRQLRHLYRRYRIEFRDGTGGPRVAKVVDRHADPKMAGLIGMADGIDPMNRKHEHIVRNYLGTLIEVMRFDPVRLENPAFLVNSEDVGVALGTLLAHEIAHTLGCRHHPVESEEDLSTVLAQGADKYGLKYMRGVRFHYETQVYLDRVLGNVPGADPIEPKFDHDAAFQPTSRAVID